MKTTPVSNFKELVKVCIFETFILMQVLFLLVSGAWENCLNSLPVWPVTFEDWQLHQGLTFPPPPPPLFNCPVTAPWDSFQGISRASEMAGNRYSCDRRIHSGCHQLG